MNAERKAKLAVLRTLIVAAKDDIAECNRHTAGADSPFWRRVACRTVFSSIEALASNAKQIALFFAEGRTGLFSDSERLALQDIEYVVEESGVLHERKAKIRTLANLVFALECLARARGNASVVVKDDGWQALTRSIKVRDRITHPKEAIDFSISDEEMRDIKKAWFWFGAALVQASKPSVG